MGTPAEAVGCSVEYGHHAAGLFHPGEDHGAAGVGPAELHFDGQDGRYPGVAQAPRPPARGEPAAGGRMRRAAVALAAAMAVAGGAAAQRAGENVVRAAEDAFGSTVGREQLGLYDEEEVRGTSPTAAGNVRIEGLYFDPRGEPNQRLRQGLAVRVGAAALGTLFPAPSGIVDYGLRLPGPTPVRSVAAGGSTTGGWFVEADASAPLRGERLGVQLGAGAARDVSHGAEVLTRDLSALARWRPSDGVEVVPFWSWQWFEEEALPILVPAGPSLPPRARRNRFDGPAWARSTGTQGNAGVVARAALAGGWTLRGGLFRSMYHYDDVFTNLFQGLRPDGSAERVVAIDPALFSGSTSGELRLSRTLAEGPRSHTLHASLRGRRQESRYGGGTAVSFGPGRLGARLDATRPDLRFGGRTRDSVEQDTLGLGYQGVWPRVGEAKLGVQRTGYRKRVRAPGLPAAATDASLWLLDASGAAALGDAVALYAGYARGLEETGEVPPSAANRLQLLPSIRTSQVDAGVRWAVVPGLRLVASVFELRRPYLTVDAEGVFTTLGTVRNRGAELSLTGKVGERLTVVAGALFTRARVEGAAAGSGEVGGRPVGLPERLLSANLDWEVARVAGLSVDLTVAHAGRRAATTDNRVSLPPRTVVDLGARYRFRAADTPATLRVQATNLTGSYGYEIVGSGAYWVAPGRAVTVSLTADF